MSKDKSLVALIDLEASHDWEGVRIALEKLQSYLEKHEPHAVASIASIINTIEALPE